MPSAKHLQQLRPKSLSKLQQARLATREQVQAVLHSLELLDVELKPGNVGYPSANPKEGTQRRYHDGKPFMYDVNKGDGVWLELEDDDRVRIILNPDEGSALFAGFQFLANLQLPVAFRRDELQLGRTSHLPVSSHDAWILCNDDHEDGVSLGSEVGIPLAGTS